MNKMKIKYTMKEAKEMNIPSDSKLFTWLRRERIPHRMAQNAIFNNIYYRVNARPYNVDLAFIYHE